MNPKEFEQWCQSLNFPSATKELIVSIRSAPPARRVQGRANNVSGTYPSRKMGVTIQFESHKVELWAIYLMEHDDEVLEYYDQPDAFKIAYTNQEVSSYQAKSLISGTRLMWDGRLWTLVNLGEKTTTLMPSQGQPLQLPSTFFLQLVDGGAINLPNVEEEGTLTLEARTKMNKASVLDLREANRRFNLVQAYLQNGIPLDCEVSGRTLRRWSKRFREAEMNYGCGYIGLLPRTKERGNRTAKAPTTSRELLDTFIGSHFETPKQAPAASVYRAYQRACEEKNILPLSQRTFYHRIKQRPQTEQTEKRLGAKAAYHNQPWYWELNYSTPRHGDRPLAIAHIDHTQLDLELRSAATGRLLGRPWATLMGDAYSRRILAVYLTFDPPSYRSCMMAIRICVARFGRFPQSVVVDGGKEFHSVYFDTLLARYHCTKKTRPGAKPRFGSVIERLFGTTNTQFVFNLLGNTQATKQVRELTPAVDPKRQAIWTLEDLYTYLSEYAYSIYDQNEHPALSLSPRAAYEQGLMQTGERLHRHLAYDEDFILATHPSTRSGLALVHPGRGIKLNYLYYWSDAFRNPMVERTKVPVRYDPFDMGSSYAFVQGRWVKCISQYYSIFSGRSEKELLLAATEIKQQAKLTKTTTTLSAKRLADFLANAPPF